MQYTPKIVHIQREHECNLSVCPETCTQQWDVTHKACRLSESVTSEYMTCAIIEVPSVNISVFRLVATRNEADAIIGSTYYRLLEGPFKSIEAAERNILDIDE